jgi:diguanylate cyclase (GGDEF)-like protein
MRIMPADIPWTRRISLIRRTLGNLWLLACLLVPAARLEALTRPIRFDNISLEQGLSQTTVLCIYQDSRGFLWLGTEDGLDRYDGYGFTVYKHDPADPNSLVDDFVWAIAEDPSGDLWIGTDGGGIARWNQKTDRFVRYGNGADLSHRLASDYVRALHLDRQGQLWIGTRDAGLEQLDPLSGLITHYRHDPSQPTSLSDDHVYVVYADRLGKLWIGTDGGLNQLDPASGALRRFVHDPKDPASLSDDRVRSIFEDRDGVLWIGTYDGGLNRLQPASGRFVSFRNDFNDPASLSHDLVRTILEDQDDRLWVGTSNGLNMFDRERGRFARYLHDPASPKSLSDNDVMSLYQDRGGVLWVGTRSGGLDKWNPATWSFGHYTESPSDPAAGLTSKAITGFSVDPSGKLWIGTYGGGLNLLDRVSGEYRHYRYDPKSNSSLSDDRVMALLHDRDGLLWIGTRDGGLNRFDLQTQTFRVYRHDPARASSLGSNGVMALLEDNRGALWVGTFGGGLDRFDRATESFTHYRFDPAAPTSLSGDRVTCLAQDPSGGLWIGTDGAGLNLLDRRAGGFRHFTHDPKDRSSLSADTIYSLHVDPAGTLWIGTRGGGLARLEGSPESGKVQFTSYSEMDGLANEAVYGILQDAAGLLWLSTNNGLSRFDPRSETFRNYDASHGLQANEFNFGAYYRSTSGELFFGGVNGFNAFFPDRLESNSHVPAVVLTALLKFNKPVAAGGPASQIRRIDLGFRDDVVTFEFAALDYAAPGKNRYAYKLDGFDSNWIELGNIHRVTYTNLDPKSYVFRVKAANNDAVWNENGLAIALTVEPPPWRTWWAYLLYTLLGAGAVFGFVWVQQRKLAWEAEYSRRLEQQVRQRTADLAERNSQLEDLNLKLAEASLTDSLTGLRNRRFLFEHVTKEIALVRRRYAELAQGIDRIKVFDLVFMMVDLDFFKAINDTCGHVAGDQILVQVRSVLESACRNSDILIRWGGDEFLLIARDSNPDNAEELAERICGRIAEQVFNLSDGQVLRTTCSVGFACYPFTRSQPDLYDWEEVLAMADSALYVAKNSSRNAWVGFMSNGQTPTGLVRTIRKEPERLAREGLLEVRSSIPSDRSLVWH